MNIKKTPLLLVLVLLLCLVSMPLSAADFDDVKDGDWFASAVDYCYDKGYFYGVSETSFGPYTTMNRAMIVTVLHRCAGTPEVENAGSFKDVPAEEWYTDAVAWGQATGVVAGFEDGTFRPDAPVTREQIMAFFYRYITQIAKKELPSEPDLRIYNSFYDVDTVESWAVPSVQWCTSVGVICGNDGYLKPGDDSNRAEIATILLRLDAYLANDMTTVTSAAENGGSVVPNGTFSLVNRTAVTFRAEPQKGWSVKGAVLNGDSLGAQQMYVVRTSKTPQTLTVSFKELVGDPYSGYGQLVNRSYPIPNAASYKPSDLKKVSYGNVQLRAEAANALDSMIAAFKKDHPGYTLYAQSGYRSHSTQIYLYDRQIGRQGGNKYKAGTISAVPGTSEHELGLAVDLTKDGNLPQSFGSTVQGKWLAAHCMEYGYILRYPADKEKIVGIIYEPWHFRYVGKAIAEDMKAKGVTTLEEYYGLYLNPADIDPYLPYLK
ncbi:MAG: D-alanyl-D-alanine carboxypeptidase family protein [Firmicutes bacterium]|nr:D-alanyl-D-alanine carboxypeptidase family protein [Bacillota bacterium]